MSSIRMLDSVKIMKLLLFSIPYVIIFIIAWHISSQFPQIPYPDALVGLAAAAVIRAAVFIKGRSAKKYRKDAEYGSARWGTEKDARPYIDPNPDNNIILTATESLTMNSRPKPVKYARNKNVLVIGGSGSGKTRFFVKPNIMQCQSKDYPVSLVITDPKGQLLFETGKLLENNGYRLKIVNTINFKMSMRYNPLLCY